MKIEFTRAEVERIILDHANRITGRTVDMYAALVNEQFNTVEAGGYRNLPDTIVVSTVRVEDAAQ